VKATELASKVVGILIVISACARAGLVGMGGCMIDT
jgi:hypothetical protein